MRLLKLAIPLIASVLLFGCISQSPQTKSSPTQSTTPPTPVTPSLKDAVKELQMIQTKIKSGINDEGYSVLITKTWPVVQNASGGAKAVAAVKSAFQGHQLALKFWECDRVEGYDKLQQCQGKALSEIFAKYPDIEAQAKAVAKSKDPSTISTRLDKDDILQKIWEKTGADTEAANRAISLVQGGKTN